MSKTTDSRAEAQILASWEANASPWTSAVQSDAILSRTTVTNRAILDAVMACEPETVLDVGCGEGWLTRALEKNDIRVIGVDAIASLVETARETGPGDFRCLSYEEIAAGKVEEIVDVVVCNFSLIGRSSVERLIESLPERLNPAGVLIVQTLHPVASCGVLPYEDGWRDGSWDGCGPNFSKPAPWFFRTIESWESLILRSGFSRIDLAEPLNPLDQKPASLLITARKR